MQSPVPVSNLQQTLANQLGNAYISLAVRGCMRLHDSCLAVDFTRAASTQQSHNQKGDIYFIVVTGGYHKCLIRVSSN